VGALGYPRSRTPGIPLRKRGWRETAGLGSRVEGGPWLGMSPAARPVLFLPQREGPASREHPRG